MPCNNDEISCINALEISEENQASFEFTVLHQNIQGLVNKQEILELTLANLSSNVDPDVLCFTESFVKHGEEKNINIANYIVASHFSRKNKSRGGSCILTKKGLPFEKVTLFDDVAIDLHFECCSILIPHHKFIIICIYRIPSKLKTHLDIFFSKLETVIHRCHLKYMKLKIIVIGDININTLLKNSTTSYFQDILKNYNLTQYITEPTRKNSCIDHIISDIKGATACLLNLLLSDHDTAQLLNCPVKVMNTVPKTYFVYKRCYSRENIQKFKNYLNQITFHDLYLTSDLNNAFNEFYDLYCLLYNLCFPIIKTKISSQTNTKWMSKGLKRSCNTKRLLRYTYYKRNTTVNKDRYKSYSRLLRNCIFHAKKYFNNKYIANSKNVCRATWHVISNEINGSDIKSKYIKNINKDDNIVTEPTKIASVFNEYFINSAKVHQSYTDDKHITIKGSLNTIYLTPIDINDIRNYIRSLKNTTSEGNDNISTKVIKATLEQIESVLVYLINLSFETGSFPDKLKLSIVKPLYKKGKKTELVNYRPISLVSIFSKIFEKAMHQKLISFLDKNHLINKNQFGFRKNKSTSLATYELVNDILHNINSKLYTTVLFLDMMKAFDSVPHDRLIKKLEINGIRGPALNWIKSYLKNRKQCVEIAQLDSKHVVQTYQSEFEYLKLGVPQGSILGPLLFLLYVNDFSETTKHRSVLFADDISVIITSNHSNTVEYHEKEVNELITDIIQWLQFNNLHINLTKTYYINFNNNLSLNIAHDGQSLRKADLVTFLGIDLDNNLNWKDHVHRVCNKINRFRFALYKICKVATRKTATMAYFSYVESVLRYGLIIWGNSTDIKHAFIAQKKCVRAICSAKPDVSCKPLFRELNILPLPCIYILEIGKFVKQHPELFLRAHQVNSRNTRYPNSLVVDTVPKSVRFKKNCYYMSIKIFNKLPEHIKILPYNQFKHSLRNWLLQFLFYSVQEFLNHNL